MQHMSFLSKSEIQFLQGQKTVSKSYEYKLKSIIKKKVTNLIDKEIPLIRSLFPNLHLTEFRKGLIDKSIIEGSTNLTKYSNVNNYKNILSKQSNPYNNRKITTDNRINLQNTSNSPAQIRTGVKGSKGLYACPLHSALVILPGFRAFLYCKYGRY